MRAGGRVADQVQLAALRAARSSLTVSTLASLSPLVAAVSLALAGCGDDEPEATTQAALPEGNASSDDARSDDANAGAASDGSGALEAPDGGDAPDAGAFGFRRDVYPLFVEYCGECHSVNGPYHDIASPDLAEAYADAVEFAPRIIARIEQGNMPPQCVFDDSACVPADDLATIERWIASGMPE